MIYMRALINIFLLAGLFLIQACSNEEEMESVVSSPAEVAFSASLSDKKAIETRGLDDEKGDIVALPYINGIYVRKIGKDQTTAVYKVQSGYKGTLENTDSSPIQWDTDLNSPVKFYAWTTPTGVTIGNEGTSGTVDFNTGNSYLETDINKVNDKFVTPLEVFIGCPVVSSTREASPSVSLPFKHLVSKLSIRVRDWNNQLVNDQVSITFLGIKDKWSVGKAEDGIQIKNAASGAANSLTLDCKNLKADEKTSEFKRIYLPPLTTALGTDFKTAGDFCIEFGSAKYYGTLNNVEQNTNGQFIQLQAGEHLHVTMDLSKNFGVGVGTKIVDWKYGEKDVIEGNPYNGIYTYDDLKRVAAAVNAGQDIPALLIDEATKTIRLYRNIQLGADWTPIGAKHKTGSTTGETAPFNLTFDGNGYTISGLTYTAAADSYAGLFGYTSANASIKNVTLSGCAVTGDGTNGAGLLIGNAENTTIENCRVIGVSSVTNTGAAAGGLIGTAGTGVTLTNCSVETSGTITGATAGALVGTFTGSEINDCFAAFTGTNGTALIGDFTSGTIKGCYFMAADGYSGNAFANTNTTTGTITNCFWSPATASSGSTDDISNRSFSGEILTTAITINGTDYTLLLDALQAGSISGKGWVYVYGKDYPVLKIK